MNSRDLLAITKHDERGRGSPAPISVFRWLEVWAASGLQPRPVPSEFWDAEKDAAVVRCPCGASATIEMLAFPVACQCDRRFFYDGTGVYSLRPPTSTRQREAAPA